MNNAPALAPAAPSRWRAWGYLILTSWQRQAHAHLMVWIAVGLVSFLTLWVALMTNRGAFDVRTWRKPSRGGLTYLEWVNYVRFAPADVLAHKPPPGLFKPGPRSGDKWINLYQQSLNSQTAFPNERTPPPPFSLIADPVQIAVAGAYSAALESEAFRGQIAVVRFTQVIVFAIFTTFLLPLCSLSFATEALGREREQRNLLWTLTRPLPRSAIYLGKFVAMLPWCLALNVGGFAVVCLAGGEPGRLAFAAFWPAIALGTIAFAALFHLLGAIFRRPAVIAILYSFFLETVMRNLPGHLKRASISYYVRSMMFDAGSSFQLRPERALIDIPVSGPAAVAVLTAATIIMLAAGSWYFSRREYLDLA